MTFLTKMEELISAYSPDVCKKYKNVVLYGLNQNPPPEADHYIFSPMDEELIQELKESYTGIIPESLIKIYRVMNGAHLFGTRIYRKSLDRYFPHYQLSLMGIQIRYPDNMYVQFDISMEDSSKPSGLPKNWLLFACYSKPEEPFVSYALYVDTDTGKVFSQIQRDVQCKTIETWNSIDECLCSIFDTLAQTDK